MKLKLLFTAAVMASSMSFAALAADNHTHDAAVEKPHADAGADEHVHRHSSETPHFAIEKPASVGAALGLLDRAIENAEKALADKDANALHKTGEELEAAVLALSGFAEDNPKLTQPLAQMSKTADRFHLAAEDGDPATAKESLQILQGQAQLVR